MKARFLSGMVALLACASVAMAQDVTAPNAAGAKAIMFTFNGLNVLGVGTINGGIGGKYFLMAPLAVRASARFATSTTTTPFTPVPNPVPAGWSSLDGKASATTVGISCGAEYHFLATRVSPYAGGEVLYSTTWTEGKPAVGGAAPLTQGWTKNALNGGANTSISFYGIVGVEFFITKELSLAGEYQAGFSTRWYPDQKANSGANGAETVITPSPQATTSGIGIGTSGLILSVYF